MLARRVSSEGRTRAYAWGRSVPREELAALGERLIAMSGQFEQRRLARPAYQLEVLDSFIGAEQLARRDASRVGVARAPGRPPPARRADPRRCRGRGAARGAARARRGHGRPRADTETSLLEERERLRHVTELAQGAADRGRGAGARGGKRARPGLAAAAERAVAPLEHLAPELARAGRRAPRRRAPAARDGERAEGVPALARGRARPARAGGGRARAALRPQAPLPLRLLP